MSEGTSNCVLSSNLFPKKEIKPKYFGYTSFGTSSTCDIITFKW